MAVATERTRNVIAGSWVGVIVFGVGLAFVDPALSGMAWLVAMVLTVITWAKASREPLPLRYPTAYRVALGLQLALAAAGLVAAASVVSLGPGNKQSIALIVTAGMTVVLATSCWRAIVRPTPRRAALVGVVAINVMVFALIIDALIDAKLRPHSVTLSDTGRGDWLAYSLVGSWIGGALSCIAAMTAFSSTAESIPEARQVDRN